MADAPTLSFSFAPPPLILNGQPIGGGINFTAANAVSQVDQASQAYDFASGQNAAAYSFLGGAISNVTDFAGNSFDQIIAGLTSIGNKEASAQQTAAGKTCSGFLGCLFG